MIMKKNSKLFLRIETEILQKLMLEAQNEGITLSELCRKKLSNNPQLERIELLLLKIFDKTFSKS